MISGRAAGRVIRAVEDTGAEDDDCTVIGPLSWGKSDR